LRIRNTVFLYIFRHEGQGTVIEELDNMGNMGEIFHPLSVSQYKMAGVFRAADIFWNTAEKK